MKKWTFLIVFLIVAGIGVMVYKTVTVDTDGYLELAEKAQKNGNYDLELFNLQKALESSIKANGTVSEKTAEIYRMLGNRDRDLNQAAEYFDQAILIYELENADKLPEVYYEKGFWLFNGGSTTQENAKEAFEEVIRLYGENQYEYSNYLCLSFYYLAAMQTDYDSIFSYLKKAEEQIPDLSEEQSWEVSTIVERAIAAVLFTNGEYENALSYYDKLIEKSEASEERRAWYILADANSVSGACLAFLGQAEAGEERIKKAIASYEERADDTLYYDQAAAYTYLAVVYASMEPPKQEEALEAGVTAFSFYKQREVISNIDMQKMDELKAYLQIAYEKIYPEKESWEFESWFKQNNKITTRNYRYYTN